ncbi:GH25 family lysozyme [Shigella flexneri]
MNFFYSTAVQIKDYIHFYGYRPVKSFAIRIPATYTIHGIDVSRWQERIDWQRVAKMRDNGIRLQFAFIKATEGEKLVAPYFSRNWQLSRENGLLRGAYHYFSPSVSASVQARLFLQTVDFSQGDFPAELDIRTGNYRQKNYASGKSVAKNGRKNGEKPIIYSGAVFYHTNLAGYFNEYPWWVAHYYQRRPDNDGIAWRFWRLSDRGQVDGIDGPVDLMCLMARWRSCRHSLMGLKKRLK